MSNESIGELVAPLIDPSSDGTSADFEMGKKPMQRRHFRILLWTCGLAALLDFSVFISMAPRTHIIEQIICREYYSKRGTDLASSQLLCKEEAIQSELALIQGWSEALTQIPGILLALPYGLMADHYGRKPVLVLFLLGVFLSDTWVKFVYLFPDTLPIRLVWLAPLIQVIGGGGQTGGFIVCTIIADVIPAQERVGALLKLTATELIAQILATPSAAAMMRQSSWYPLGLSSILILGAVLISIRIPETGPVSQRISCNEEQEMSPGFERHEMKSWTLQKLIDSTQVIRTSPVILVLLFVFLIGCFGQQSLQLLLQYMSKIFDWEYSTASLVITFRSLFHLFLVILIMPSIDTYMSRRLRLAVGQKDFKLTQGSGIFLFVGFFILGLAKHPAGFVFGLITIALGSAFLVTLRSAMTSLVPPSSVGILYTAASVAHGVGNFVAGPVLALTFHWGMVLGGRWIGLPFFLTSVLYLIALMMMLYSSRIMRR